MPGYISLHRDIQKHWLYEEERVFSRYEAWIDILMKVNHAEGKVTHNGTVETVPRGSAIWSIGDMEQHWGWSNRKVKRFLDCLVNDQMLTYKSTTKKTYLTVVNYDFYQGGEDKKAPPMHHQSTTDAFQKHTNNNVNNLNNLFTTTAAMSGSEYLTISDVHTKVFKTLNMSGLMSEYIMSLKSKGMEEETIKELMLETGESASNDGPNLRLMKTIGDRWLRDKVKTRDQAREEKQKAGEQFEKHRGGVEGVRSGGNPPKSNSNEGESKIYPGKWDNAPLPKMSG